MIMKAHVSRAVKFAVSLLSLGCLFVAIVPSTARAQGGYPPGGYPPQGNPPPRHRFTSGYKLFEPKYEFSLFLGARFGGKIAINTPNVVTCQSTVRSIGDSMPVRASCLTSLPNSCGTGKPPR